MLVGSVFSDCPRTKIWYKLQINALQNTTDFKHVVYPNCDVNFTHSTVLPRGHQNSRLGHIEGLNALLDYFRQNNEFEYFLLLDSDCFPIVDWTDKLIKSMKHYNVAAPIRCENLDFFAHPCAFFLTRKALNDVHFLLANFNGYLEDYQETASNVKSFFPLVRSNRLNYHPILFGVYWNMFYHHGAGSRRLNFRTTENGYYDKEEVVELEKNMFNQLVKNPEMFVAKLMGKSVHDIKVY